MTGVTIDVLDRHGKFLLFHLNSGDVLVVNAMITGRFQHVDPEAIAKARKHPARTGFVFTLSDGTELRYVDDRFMGKAYLVAADALDTVP